MAKLCSSRRLAANGRGWATGSMLGFVTVLATIALGCGTRGETVDVFAASSLAGAFAEIEALYEADTGIDVRLNLAASSTLREQLRDGASADVFVAANPSIVDDLVADGTLDGSPQPFVSNQLVLAVPADNPGAVVALGDLADDDLLVGVCTTGVPCGDLADEWLRAVGVSGAADTAEPDARSLAQRLADRELDVGLVYASDVVGSDGSLIAIDGAVDGPTTTYPLVSLSGRGASFASFLQSERAQAIMRRWGFVAADEAP